ncbi:2'-5' RNA ligase family protein [Rufibacter latericius]|uniref:2'-5' RNA ligase family protein n=1 Tax=Rufibacter latericius TaxID=2487040 RepID=A0A3M9MUH7_9BACT|nr:2'-5' RNA ligase family protein [Rufibacter latericius]RNI29174.1 2'-5' RNA ligase family protein [Rufibacter latericius]
MTANPLILTLTLNKEAFEFFTSLRDAHFPPERNFLKAHLTLFHHLPPGESTIHEVLSAVCLHQKQMKLEVPGLMNIGNGVAYKIASEELQQLHKNLQQQWQPLLIPQDKQKLHPHITVQNKVAPAVAKELESTLKDTFVPFTIVGIGLTLWEYMGGPWKLYREYSFQP